MQETFQINLRHLFVFVLLFTIGDAILVLPAFPAFRAGQDAWLSGLAAMLMAIPFLYLLTSVGKLYAGTDFYSFLNGVFGKFAGRAVILLLTVYWLLNISAHIREIGDFLTTQNMPRTPIEAFHILFIFLLAWGARLGVGTIIRVSMLFFPIFLLLFSILVLFILPEVNVKNLLPVFENGLGPIMFGSFTTFAFPFMENIVLLVFFSFVERTGSIRKPVIIGALLGGAALNLILLLSVLVLSAPITADQVYPSYALAKKISIGRFFERIEVLLATMWILTTFIKTMANFYGLLTAVAALFSVKNWRMLAYPAGMIILVLSIAISPDIVFFNDVVLNYWPYLDFVCCFGLAAALYVIYRWKHN